MAVSAAERLGFLYTENLSGFGLFGYEPGPIPADTGLGSMVKQKKTQ